MNQLMVGSSIEKYRIDNLLGQGGMGSVYLAYDQELKRTVALKVMHPHLAQKPQFIDRFLLEAQTSAQLSDHPSIVNIFDFKQSNQFLFLVMEHVKGGSLGGYVREMVNKGQIIQVAEALTLSIQVIEALGHAHRQQPPVVHRDIKPDNILLRPLNTPTNEMKFTSVVTDFGLAKLLNEDNYTRTGGIMGTLSYMSPEQARGKSLDGRSDLYSVGVMIFYLLSGQLPLSIKTAPEALFKLQNDMPPPLSQIRPGLPAELDQIVAKTLAKNPADRYKNAAALAAALRSVLKKNPVLNNVQPPSQETEVVSLATQLWEASMVSMPSLFPNSQAAPNLTSDYVVVVQKGEPPRTIPLDISSITIGRTSDNKITLPAHQISRRHAQLTRTHKGWQITDLGSTNKTFLAGRVLPAHAPHPWAARQTVRVGPFALRWYPANTPEQLGITEFQTSILQSVVEPGGSTFRSQSGRVGVVVNPTSAAIGAGNVARFKVNLFNQGVVADRLSLSVPNLPQAWVKMTPHEHHLGVGEELAATVEVQLPRDSGLQAGSRTFELQIDSTIDAADSVSIPCQLEIAPSERFSVEMSPSSLQSGEPSRIIIHNEGNARTQFRVLEQPSDVELEVQLSEPAMTVVPGRAKQTDVTVVARKRPLFGKPKTHPFQLEVQTASGLRQPVQGKVTVKPWLASWMVALLLLLGIGFPVTALGTPLVRELMNPSTPIPIIANLPTFTPTPLGEAEEGVGGSGNAVGGAAGVDDATLTVTPTATETDTVTPTEDAGLAIITLPPPTETPTTIPTATPTNTPPPTHTPTETPSPTLTPTNTPPPPPTNTPTPAVIAPPPTLTPTPFIVIVVPGILVPIVPDVPIESKDCIDYDEDNLSIVNEGASGWLLTDGFSRMLVLDNQQDAEDALAVAKAHGEQCFIGRGNNRENRRDYIVRYWQTGTNVAVDVENEDCIDYDEDSLSIVNEGASGWLLTDGFSRMLVLDNQQDAQDALLLAQSYSEQCFVGRDNNREDRRQYIMQYWR